MKRLLKLFPLALLLCIALTLGLAACSKNEKSYSVTAEFDAAAGSVVLSEEGKGADGKYTEGASVTVTVTPKAGYGVQSFTVNGTPETLSESGTFTFTVKQDTAVKATFGKTSYSVTLEKNFEETMGSASLSAPADGKGYVKDELVTLTVSVNEGYVLESIKVGDETVEAEDGKYSFLVKADTAVIVTIRAIGYYSVTVAQFDEAAGSVKVTPAPNADGKYRENTSVSVAVTVNYGYRLRSLQIGGAEAEPAEDGVYSFEITADTEVKAIFEELAKYKVTATYDAALCDVTCLVPDEDGTSFVETSLKDVAELYTGEIEFTVNVTGGYELVSVTVNGEEAEVTDGKFTVNLTENIQIVVVCKWSYNELTAFAGEYTLGTNAWYAFTLGRQTTFDLSADSYAAYAAFYKVNPDEIAPPKTGEDGDKPVWVFNMETSINTDIHTFEAGTYLASMSADVDGVFTTKLTVTEISALTLQLPESYRGAWKSTDGVYSMNVGADYLVLKKDMKIVPAVVTYEQDGQDSDYALSFDGEKYWLVPYFGVTGSLALTKDKRTADRLFLPNPQPSYFVPEDLVGVYGAANQEESADDLTFLRNSITWGEKKLTLLTQIDLASGMPMALVRDSASDAIYVLVFQQVSEKAYSLMLITDPESPDAEPLVFLLKETDPPASIDQSYWGTWECLTKEVQFTGYTLEIGASSVTVKDASGQPVACTVSTYERFTTSYPKLTIGENEYYLSLQGRAPNVSLRMTLISDPTKFFTFSKQSAPATAEASAVPFADSLVGQWQNEELGLSLTVEKNSVTVANLDGNSVEHTLRLARYRGKVYNALVLDGTVYLFLKANGT